VTVYDLFICTKKQTAWEGDHEKADKVIIIGTWASSNGKIKFKIAGLGYLYKQVAYPN